jgi:hypothetical protein
MFIPQNLAQAEYAGSRPCDLLNAEHAAYAIGSRNLFNSARSAARTHRIKAFITRRSTALIDLSAALSRTWVLNQSSEGVRPVDLDNIIGSENRSSDFDQQFAPLSERTMHRWMSVAAVILSGGGLPAVELIEVGGYYFVRDGHHRISVARALGYGSIDAHVTHWQVSGCLPWEKEMCPAGVPAVPAF